MAAGARSTRGESQAATSGRRRRGGDADLSSSGDPYRVDNGTHQHWSHAQGDRGRGSGANAESEASLSPHRTPPFGDRSVSGGPRSPRAILSMLSAVSRTEWSA